MWEVVALGCVCADVRVHGSGLVWASVTLIPQKFRRKRSLQTSVFFQFFSHSHTKQNPSFAKKKKEYLLASVQLAAMHLLPMAHRKEQ